MLRRIVCRVVHGTMLTAAAAFTLGLVAGPGRAAQVCVLMDNSGYQVAGMQVDLTWDNTCMQASTSGTGSAGQCVAHPSTGKTVSSRVNGPSLRAIFFSTDNVDPIPDGELFCCTFTQPARPCCGLQLSKLITSDPTGRRLGDPGIQFIATVAGEACAQLGVAGGTSSAPAARGLEPRQPAAQAPVVESGPGQGAPPQQQAQQEPPAQQAPAAKAPPIGVPPPTLPREAPAAREEGAEIAAQPEGQAEAGAAVAGAARVPEAAPEDVAAAPAAGTATATVAAAEAAVSTPAAAAATSTPVRPTNTPTQPLPTATPTARGFLSGC
jgi:hypothetical protein